MKLLGNTQKHCPRLVDVHINARWPRAEVTLPKHKEDQHHREGHTEGSGENGNEAGEPMPATSRCSSVHDRRAHCQGPDGQQGRDDMERDLEPWGVAPRNPTEPAV